MKMVLIVFSIVMILFSIFLFHETFWITINGNVSIKYGVSNADINIVILYSKVVMAYIFLMCIYISFVILKCRKQK